MFTLSCHPCMDVQGYFRQALTPFSQWQVNFWTEMCFSERDVSGA